jgi:hypothetical protein
MAFSENDTISNSPTGNTPPSPAPQDQQQPQQAATPVTQQDGTAQTQSTISNPGASQGSKPQNLENQLVSGVASPQPDPVQDHPLVKKAGLLNAAATALAGGQRYNVTIDADGNRTRTPIPTSGKHIAMAIALEAIQGSLTGLAAGRGRGPGAAGAAAMAQGISQRQQQTDRQNQIAQQDAENRSTALARKAQAFEVNSRTMLNTAEAEKYGSDAIDKIVQINRASGILDVDPATLENGGQPMTQDELHDALKSGKISPTDSLGPIVGRVEVTDKDGSKRWEATHLIVKDANSKVNLSQEDFDRFAAAGVPGYPAGVKIGPNGVEVKLSTLQRATEIVATRTLSDYRLKDMKDTLAGTPYADKVPSTIDFSKPGVSTAMEKFQRYISHSNMHGQDVFESLQTMGADKRDPKTGAMQRNPDAQYVDTVASAMGGWSTLEAVHNQLAADKKVASEFAIVDSEAKANAIIATPNKFTKDQISSAKNFLTLSEQAGAKKAAQEARSRAVAEGKDVESMIKTGINPITGEKLSLNNAPDSALVDSKGRPVPQNMQSFYKPSQNERQTADTARQALAISSDLRAAIAKNPNLVGPLLGNSKEGLAKLGFGNEQAQKMLNDISFLQSAATKVHTGRFSSEILHKMGNMIKPGMNPQQFVGGLNSIDEVMNRYAQEDKLVTVSDFKAMQQEPAGTSSAPQLSNIQVNPTTKQTIGWNGSAWVDASTGKAVQ